LYFILRHREDVK